MEKYKNIWENTKTNKLTHNIIYQQSKGDKIALLKSIIFLYFHCIPLFFLYWLLVTIQTYLFYIITFKFKLLVKVNIMLVMKLLFKLQFYVVSSTKCQVLYSSEEEIVLVYHLLGRIPNIPLCQRQHFQSNVNYVALMVFCGTYTTLQT